MFYSWDAWFILWEAVPNQEYALCALLFQPSLALSGLLMWPFHWIGIKAILLRKCLQCWHHALTVMLLDCKV